MPRRRPITWRDLARRQSGILARRQLSRLGLGKDYVDTQLAAERWRRVSPVVVATTTGPLSRDQLIWSGVLHAGPVSAVGGLTALELHGLKNWHRDEVSILVPKSQDIEPLDGVQFVETRRPVLPYRARASKPPCWQVEPAALLWAAYEPVTRSAYGLLAAVVQQGLATPSQLDAWITGMRPLRRAKPFRGVLQEFAGGAQSVAELDIARMCREHVLPPPKRQQPRRDAAGRLRYTDAEWWLPGGRVVVLEVDGAFHMEAEHWEADIERDRDLASHRRLVVRATARQMRDERHRVAAALRRLGVAESSA